jgi:hypothetical protein
VTTLRKGMSTFMGWRSFLSRRTFTSRTFTGRRMFTGGRTFTGGRNLATTVSKGFLVNDLPRGELRNENLRRFEFQNKTYGRVWTLLKFVLTISFHSCLLFGLLKCFFLAECSTFSFFSLQLGGFLLSFDCIFL